MKKSELSIVLATYNEEKNLSKCLDSVKDFAGEIIIVDGNSTDNTVTIAKKYGSKVISTTNKRNFHINKNIAIRFATKAWTLQLDADEVVSPQLASEILSVIANPKSKDGYWVNRKNWFLSRFLSKGGQYPDPTLRLYRTGKGILPEQDVHEQAKIDGEVGVLKNDLLHYRDLTFEKYLDGFNRYSSFVSGQLVEKRVNQNMTSFIKYVLIKPIYTFLNIYIRHRGYVDGFPGFIFALFSGLIHPASYFKLFLDNK